MPFTASLTRPSKPESIDAEILHVEMLRDGSHDQAVKDAADASGNIVVAEGLDVEVEIFNCGPQPIQEAS